MAKTFRCVALDNPADVEVLTSDISGDLSRYKTISIGARSFAVNPLSDDHVRRLAARYGIRLTKAISGLSPEEADFAALTEFQQSAASVFGDELIEQWRTEDAADEEADDSGPVPEQREILRDALRLERFGAAICRNGGGAYFAELRELVRGNLNGISVERGRQLLSALTGYLVDAGCV